MHATCVAIGEAGVLIRGASGSGKSRLARRLIEEGARAELFARLVSDDRTLLECRSGRLLARPHPAIAGRLEMRGLGIGEAAFEGAVRLSLIVDIAPGGPRMPVAADETAEILGVELPRIRIGPEDWDMVMIALGRGCVRRCNKGAAYLS